MAFIASQLSLQRGFEALCNVALQQKNYLANWSARLAGNITALDAVEIMASVNQAVTLMDQYAALPGMQAYAQQMYGSAQYDVATQYSSMRSTLVAVREWLKTNIPANSISISNGVQVGQSYAPAATAPLKALVEAARATIT